MKKKMVLSDSNILLYIKLINYIKEGKELGNKLEPRLNIN